MKRKREPEQAQERTAGFHMGQSEACKYLYQCWMGSSRDPTMNWLLEIAEILTKKTSVVADRLAKRHKPVLLWWFDQHWQTFAPVLSSIDLPDCPASRTVRCERKARLVDFASPPDDQDVVKTPPDDQDIVKTADETPPGSTATSVALGQDSNIEGAQPTFPLWWEPGGQDDNVPNGDELSNWTQNDSSGSALEPPLELDWRDSNEFADGTSSFPWNI